MVARLRGDKIETSDALNPPPDNYDPTLYSWPGDVPAVVESSGKAKMT
jgi:hypothetical protein